MAACVALSLLYHYIFTGGMQLEWIYGSGWINCVWQSVIGVYVVMVCGVVLLSAIYLQNYGGDTIVYCKIWNMFLSWI